MPTANVSPPSHGKYGDFGTTSNYSEAKFFPGVTVKQTKNGKRFISRLKVRGNDFYVGTLKTLEEAVVIREIAKCLWKNNNTGFLSLEYGGYVDSIPSTGDEERYFPIPPLTEATEGEKKNEAVRNRSKQIYTDFKKKQDERLFDFINSLEQKLMEDDDVEGHGRGYFEAGPSELVNDKAPDLAAVVVPDNQLCQVDPTNISPTTHSIEGAETQLHGSQDSWRTDAPDSQVPSSEEASPISPPAPLSNSIAPTVDREALFAQPSEAGPSKSAPVVVSDNQLYPIDLTNSSPAMHLNEAPMNGSQDSWRIEPPQRQLFSCGGAALISPPAPFSNSTGPTVDREALFTQLAFSDQQEIKYLKPLYKQIVISYQQENDMLKRAVNSCQQENQELKRRLAEHLSCCSEENQPTKKR